MSLAAIVVAAGRGTRAGGPRPKQYQDLGELPVLAHTLIALTRAARSDHLVVVLHPDDRTLFETRVAPHLPQPARLVDGGAERSASVRAGLSALPDTVTRVLVHDAARPIVSAALVAGVLDALATHAGAAPAVAVSDALWRGANGRVTATQDRAGLFRAQTPQGFDRATLVAAYAAWPDSGPAPADDVEVARRHGVDVAITPGDEDNIKITQPGDFARAQALLARRDATGRGHGQEQTGMDLRCGNGFDVHAFTDGDAVVLCGVTIPHDKALSGHSDADVGMHAVTDALYGALAEGDIGQHFPPSDPQWKGADSAVFLRHAVERVAARGLRIANADCTLICEHPKIGPHAAAMRDRMATLLGIGADRVSVKATTSERLGFTGRGEGIAALATVALIAA